MKGLFIALLIAVAAAVLAGHKGVGLRREDASASSGTDGGNTQRQDTKREPRWRTGGSACTVTVDAPGRDRTNGRVTSAAQYRCNRPGAGLDLSLYLQRQDANHGWINVDRRIIMTEPKDTTADRPQSTRSAGVSAVCEDGVYRAFIRGTATIDGRDPQVIEQTSRTVTNPCKALLAH